MLTKRTIFSIETNGKKYGGDKILFTAQAHGPLGVVSTTVNNILTRTNELATRIISYAI